MIAKVDTAMIKLWDDEVGAVSWLEDQSHAVFEFAPGFLKKGLDIAPIVMSLETASRGDGRFIFPALNETTYLGLPGLLADTLPDKFGQQIINTWLARSGRDIASFSPVERLCYMGTRSMGALEFEPAINQRFEKSVSVEVAELVGLAQDVMQQRATPDVALNGNEKENADALLDILRVGTSAGGARPKAIIAMNADGKVLSGQTQVPNGYDYWLLKFDGVTDIELGEPHGYGRIEYAYYLMAKAAGIIMTECRLLQENGRAHFMTRRFDRVADKKIHMSSLCGIAHYDFNMAGAYSYEQAFQIMRRLKLSKVEMVEQYRRMVFNVLARNLDDHTKNITFLMSEDGEWSLSPAYDVTYAHNPAGQWTNQHQMSINAKRDNITSKDLVTVAEVADISNADTIVEEVKQAIEKWPVFATEAGVSKKRIDEIAKYHGNNF